MTTRGFNENTTREVTRIMHEAFVAHEDDDALAKLHERVIEISLAHPLPA